MALRRSKRLKLQAESEQAIEDEQEEHSNQIEEVKRKFKYPVRQDTIDLSSLNDYCLYSILDHLSLDDICVVGLTCKRLYEVAATHFQRRYKAKVLIYDKVNQNGDLVTRPNGENYINTFTKDIQNVTFSKNFAVYANLKQLSAYYENDEDVTSIKELRLEGWGRGLRLNQRKLLSNLVKDVESFTFSNSKVKDDLNKCVLQLMPKLKELTLWDTFKEPEDESVTWMEQTYPNLKRFSCHLVQTLPLVKIKNFLHINPNIKFISLRLNSPSTIEQLVREQIRADELFVEILRVYVKNKIIMPELDDLLSLCQQQPCRLHLKFHRSTYIQLKTVLNKLVSLAPYIEGLYFENEIDVNLAQLLTTFQTLKVLQFTISANADILCRIPNLCEIYAYWGVDSSNFRSYRRSMMIYARHSMKLKKIYVRNNSQRFKNFQFEKMDAERHLLPRAEKLKIYIKTQELYYMGKLNDIERNYDLVEIVRVESEIVKNPLVTEYLTTKQLNEARIY